LKICKPSRSLQEQHVPAENADEAQDRSMTLASLFHQTGDALKDCVHTCSADELKQLFAEIWSGIRQKSLYGGQPRSGNSGDGVQLAQLALSLATHAADHTLLLEAWCMLAYTFNANEQYSNALEYYRLAIEGLENVQDHARAARTRLGYVTALSMVGRSDEAIEVGLRAQTYFLENGDDHGYARACVNIGNVYQRLDQPSDSFKLFENAIHYFRKANDEQALAQAFLNLGNALAWLDRFEQADESYAASEQLSERLGLGDLFAQARYNRAYLYFLRGRNLEAVDHFGKLRTFFKDNASHRHTALCDLDETEIYLQLNLPNDAAQLARSAAEAFKHLGMRYEQAKATAFLGVALTQNRQFGDALEVFRSAQSLFEEENNQYWVALSKLYRAEVLYAVGRLWEARALASSAHEKFNGIGVVSKRMLSTILLSRVALDLNQDSQAADYVRSIRDWVNKDANPLLLFPSYSLCAYASERFGNLDEAHRFYDLAARQIETRRTHINHDELRVLFFPGKQAVYEWLLRRALGDENGQADLSNAYTWCQRTKSTAMAGLVAHHLTSIKSHGDDTLLSRISRIRDELNNSYLRLRSEKADMPAVSNASSIEIKEGELLSNLRELSKVDPEYVSLHDGFAASLEEIQSAIPVDTTLVEFFTLGNEVAAFVMTRERVTIFRHLSPLGRVRYIEDQLRTHLSKIQTIRKGATGEANLRSDFADAQLAELYQRLIAPMRHEVQTPGLIIIPHGVLHYVPFAALRDGANYLLDSFQISYAPTTSLLQSSLRRSVVGHSPPLIFCRPTTEDDPEIAALRSAAPDATWCTGATFTRERFLKNELKAEFVHISTDVTLRHDNPMFSCLRSEDSWVTAVDLYSMSCETNLIGLFANITGLNPATGSESMMTITEALLYAGARSVITGLWNVDRETTGEFVTVFYREWRNGATKCAAAREAALAIRRKRQHPFFWASYVLTGQR
jgi:tetratricopeptide (TPR) repeat protein